MPRTRVILSVEDNADDDYALRRAIGASGVECDFHRVSSVAAAKSYLTGKTPYENRARYPLPDLLITDLSMPHSGETSVELVQWVRSRNEYAALPILCSTGSVAVMHQAMERLGVRCFEKTSKFEALVSAITELLL